MPTAEKISEYLSQMPEPYQAEILHYVEFLWSKLQAEGRDRDDLLWQELSLASALRDMDEADEVTYSADDLKERFYCFSAGQITNYLHGSNPYAGH